MVKIKARFRPKTRLIDLHLKNDSIGPVPARDNTKVHLHQKCPWQVELGVTDVSTGKELNSKFATKVHFMFDLETFLRKLWTALSTVDGRKIISVEISQSVRPSK